MSAEPGRKTPYSTDIGWRIVLPRLGLDMSFGDIAARLQIAMSTAHHIFRRFQDTGDVFPLKQPVRQESRKLDDLHELLIIAMVVDNPSVYLREMCQRIYDATCVRISGSTVCRILRRNGYTRKVQQVASKDAPSTELPSLLKYYSSVRNVLYGLMKLGVMLGATFVNLVTHCKGNPLSTIAS